LISVKLIGFCRVAAKPYKDVPTDYNSMKELVISRSQGDLHREPPTRVPYGENVLRDIFSYLPAFSDAKRVSPSADGESGLCPNNPQAFTKA
jgi:hypothetical protein